MTGVRIEELPFKRISRDNGLWASLTNQWEAQCLHYAEEFQEYAIASMPVLSDLASQAQITTAGVYGLKDQDDNFSVICQLNLARLPGFTGKVLRVRHIIYAPKYDFDDNIDLDNYIEQIGLLTANVFVISETEMEAPDIKLHFRSPTEREFFEQFRDYLAKGEESSKAELKIKGSWLYIHKPWLMVDQQ